MFALILGLALFYALHVVRIVAPNFRETAIKKLGDGGWKGVYSLVSLAGLALIVFGWMQFRPSAPELYTPPSWGVHVQLTLMWAAFVAHFTSFRPAGRIKAYLQHPFVTAFIWWSAGHLLVNGDMASVILFGSFLIYSIWTRIAVAQRDEPKQVFVSYAGDIFGLVVGTITYLIFGLWVHGYLFGVSPF